MLTENASIAIKEKTMDVKKTESLAQSKPYNSPAVTTHGMINFFSDVKAEFKKINWTSTEELKAYTKIVVSATFFLGMGIYCTDLLIQTFFNGLNVLIRFVS